MYLLNRPRPSAAPNPYHQAAPPPVAILLPDRRVTLVEARERRHHFQRAAVRDGNWKLVVDRRTGEDELFNMEQDPSEQRNLAAGHPQRVQALAALLQQQAKLDPEQP